VRDKLFNPKLYIVILLLVCILLYCGIFTFLCSTPMYDINAHTNNDRFFSNDDSYYINSIYSTTLENTDRIIKHPLFMVYGHVFTLAERLIFGEISLKSHYKLVVFTQIIVSTVAVFFLYKALNLVISELNAFILCLIYALSNCTIIYTFVAESYIYSSLAIIMTFYFARQNKMFPLIILGIIVTGITTTNCFIWALIVLLSHTTIRKKITTCIISGIGFVVTVAISPVSYIFLNRIFIAGAKSLSNYSDSFGILESIKRTFFGFFQTTLFFGDVEYQSPFGHYQNNAISFVPSAKTIAVIFSILWVVLLIYAIIKHAKDGLPEIAVIAFCLILHGLVQYGLKEVFLYSLHHLSAQILLVGYLFKNKNKYLSICTGTILIFEVIFNFILYSSVLIPYITK